MTADLTPRLADACRPAATPEQGLAILMWLRARGLLEMYALQRAVDGESAAPDLNATIAEQARTIAELQRALSLSNHKPKEAIPMFPITVSITITSFDQLDALKALTSAASTGTPVAAPTTETPKASRKKADPTAGQTGQAAPAPSPAPTPETPAVDPEARYAEVAGKLQALMKARTAAGEAEATVVGDMVKMLTETAGTNTIRALKGQADMLAKLDAVDKALDAMAAQPAAAPQAAAVDLV